MGQMYSANDSPENRKKGHIQAKVIVLKRWMSKVFRPTIDCAKDELNWTVQQRYFQALFFHCWLWCRNVSMFTFSVLSLHLWGDKMRPFLRSFRSYSCGWNKHFLELLARFLDNFGKKWGLTIHETLHALWFWSPTITSIILILSFNLSRKTLGSSVVKLEQQISPSGSEEMWSQVQIQGKTREPITKKFFSCFMFVALPVTNQRDFLTIWEYVFHHLSNIVCCVVVWEIQGLLAVGPVTNQRLHS